jgi:hypothetical protein
MEVSPHFLLLSAFHFLSFVSCMFLLIPYLECWFARRLFRPLAHSTPVATQWSHTRHCNVSKPLQLASDCILHGLAFVGELKKILLGRNFASLSLVDCAKLCIYFTFNFNQASDAKPNAKFRGTW